MANMIFAATPRPPCNLTLGTLTASAAGASYVVDLQMVDRASVHFNLVTITSAGTSAAKLQASSDGVNFADIPSATASLTGTTANFLIRIGQVDFRYLKVVMGTPSAGVLTVSVDLFCKGIVNGY